jgi:hypothetical protein
MNPVDTDTDGARDFLDTDSDNDCAPDWDSREDGAARTDASTPNSSADANCGMGFTCNRMTGRCVPVGDTAGDGLPVDDERQRLAQDHVVLDQEDGQRLARHGRSVRVDHRCLTDPEGSGRPGCRRSAPPPERRHSMPQPR